jgi:cyclic beta-1,2-glucan synthetase
MNRVGAQGAGESVWLAWFLVRTLKDFVELAVARGDLHRADFCRSRVEQLLQAVERHAWDGAWYRRAFYDDGTPIGSHGSPDCRIDAIAQSWAVIAGGDPSRARQALASSEAALVQDAERMMLLLDPPFSDPTHDPGYIRSYPPGIRENGGQYTHGVLWTVHALCLLGEGRRAHRLFSLLNPLTHATDPASVARYRVEPYVLAADVYSSPEHRGRGGWTWYTGSASWMYRIAIEGILGLQRRGNALVIAPCVPPEWTEFQVTYRYDTSELQINFENPGGASTGVRSVELDGRRLPDARVPLVDDRRTHRVRVLMDGKSDGAERLPGRLSENHAHGAH